MNRTMCTSIFSANAYRRQNFIRTTDAVEKRVGSEKRLIRDLMKDYDKYARPRLSINHPITVLVDLIVIQFEDLVSFYFLEINEMSD